MTRDAARKLVGGCLGNMAEPCPVMVKTNRESERPYRRVDCDYYGKCLDIALKSRWSDFACTKCEAYARTRFIEQATGLDECW